MFITSGVSFIKYACRSKPTIIDGVEIQHAQKSDFTSESWDRIQSLQHRADGSTLSSMSDGRFIHKGFKCGTGKERLIKGFGKADSVIGKTIYELKPNNPWSITKGIEQLHRYNTGLGGGYTLVLVLY